MLIDRAMILRRLPARWIAEIAGDAAERLSDASRLPMLTVDPGGGLERRPRTAKSGAQLGKDASDSSSCCAVWQDANVGAGYSAPVWRAAS